MMASENCSSDYGIEMHFLAEGSSEASKHMLSCATCRDRMAKMRVEGEGYMGSEAAAALRERLLIVPPRRVWSSAPFKVSIGLLALAAALLPLIVQPDFEHLSPKGAGNVGLGIVKGGALLQSAETVSIGSPLQLTWSADTGGFLAVLGQDSAGQIEILFPERDAPQRLGRGLNQPIGRSLAFDAPESRYRLIAVFSTTFFVVENVMTILRNGQIPNNVVNDFSIRVIAP